jgi:hypothetical protein
MAVDEPLKEKINEHILANSQQELSSAMTAYEVVDTCFNSIALLRRNKSDWKVVTTQVVNSFEAVTGQKISISPSTLERYYYAIKAASSGKKRKRSKRRPSVAKPLPVVESVDVVEAEAEAMKPETTADVPKDTVTAPRKSRKKAAEEGGFQVPRRPGFIPPVHL